ncbi:MAG: DUF2892 domain-containing protein [Saprospiraceae bacterium]
MKANLHSFDRIGRMLFAAVVAVLFYMGIISGTTAIVLGVVAIVLLLTSLVNFCPLYAACGISTKPKN